MSGTLYERTSSCNEQGYEQRPLAGRRLVVRAGDDNSTGPILTEVVTGQDGHFEFRATQGTWCVFPAGRNGIVCALVVKAGLEGSWNQDIVLDAWTPIECENKRTFKVRVRTTLATAPCGDRGLPLQSLPLKSFLVVPDGGSDFAKGTLVYSDAAGGAVIELRRGQYCLAPLMKAPGPPQGVLSSSAMCKERELLHCQVPFVVEHDEVAIELRTTRTCGDPCVLGEPSLPPSARGIGRVAVPGGTRHVRGEVLATASSWGGRPSPHISEPQAGIFTRILVYPGDKNTGLKDPVADVLADENGAFDIALPDGSWCLAAAAHDRYLMPIKPRPLDPDFDQECLQRLLARCDLLVKLSDGDIEGAKVRLHTYSPADQPCRKTPYRGPAPP